MSLLDNLKFFGKGLARPECVLCTKAGNVYVSDWRGGVTQIRADGSQTRFLAQNTSFEVKPNGIALMPDGSFLLAHLGQEDGGVYRLTRDGELSPFLLEIEGKPIPPTNYVHLDKEGRIWITVSTRIQPRHLAYRRDNADGFVILYQDGKAHIAADGLGYTNECLVHPSGRWLYVNETFTRKLSRFTIEADGSLTNKETVAAFGHGVFPDGLVFAEDDSVFITSIVSNRVMQVDTNGNQTVIVEDCDEAHLNWVEDAFQNGEMARPHLDRVESRVLRNISSLAFGGADLKTAYLGCLLGERVAAFSSEVAGMAPVHWAFDG